MKKLLSLTTFCLLSILIVMGCKPNVKEGVSHIYGTMESKQWDGKKIFLVPMFGPQDAAHVDSVVIKDGKFEFTADSTELKIIRLDYHFRQGTQELLVVSEPGNVKVFIGRNSMTAGTPQNDSLQVWKVAVTKYNETYNQLRAEASKEGSDQLLLTKGKEIQKSLREFTGKMADRQPEGVLKKFLKLQAGRR